MKTSILFILLSLNLFSQNESGLNKGFDKPFGYGQTHSRNFELIEIDSNDNYTYIPMPDQNLLRDDCGNWYRQEKFYTSWKSRPVSQGSNISERKSISTMIDLLDPCWKPNEYKSFEYRLDIENKVEWYREVSVKFIKL